MARSIIIADVDGQNPIVLQNLRVPGTYPELIHEGNGAKSVQCRRTSISKGARVWHGFGGLTANHLQLNDKITLELINGLEIQKFMAWNAGRPPVVLFSIDGGATRYFAIIPDDGFDFSGYRFWEDPLLAKPLHNKISIRPYILSETNQGFDL